LLSSLTNSIDKEITYSSVALGNHPRYPDTVDINVQCLFPNHNDKHHGLSAGAVLLIIFFSLVGAYVLVGVLVNTFVHKETGVHRFPHADFWLGVPGLVKVYKNNNQSFPFLFIIIAILYNTTNIYIYVYYITI
jgi:hypothetical protein